MRYIKLCELDTDCEAKISHFSENREINKRLFDLGLTENTTVRCVLKGPSGDPSAYLIRGAVIALRKCDCEHIFVQEAEKC